MCKRGREERESRENGYLVFAPEMPLTARESSEGAGGWLTHEFIVTSKNSCSRQSKLHLLGRAGGKTRFEAVHAAPKPILGLATIPEENLMHDVAWRFILYSAKVSICHKFISKPLWIRNQPVCRVLFQENGRDLEEESGQISKRWWTLD